MMPARKRKAVPNRLDMAAVQKDVAFLRLEGNMSSGTAAAQYAVRKTADTIRMAKATGRQVCLVKPEDTEGTVVLDFPGTLVPGQEGA
jgi:hypothetical protein